MCSKIDNIKIEQQKLKMPTRNYNSNSNNLSRIENLQQQARTLSEERAYLEKTVTKQQNQLRSSEHVTQFHNLFQQGLTALSTSIIGMKQREFLQQHVHPEVCVRNTPIKTKDQLTQVLGSFSDIFIDQISIIEMSSSNDSLTTMIQVEMEVTFPCNVSIFQSLLRLNNSDIPDRDTVWSQLQAFEGKRLTFQGMVEYQFTNTVLENTSSPLAIKTIDCHLDWYQGWKKCFDEAQPGKDNGTLALNLSQHTSFF